ncbi:MAG: START domain-containing protein [Bacteroidota bacterium]
MSKYTFTIFFLFFFSYTHTQTNWDLRKEKDNIKIFTAKIEGSNFKAFKGETTVEASKEEIITILKDPEETVNWMPKTAEAQLIQQDEKGHIAYFVNNAPWPVKDRDGVYQFKYINQSDGSFLLDIQALPDYWPSKKNKVRIEKSSSSWQVIPIDNQKVKVIYQAHAEPGGNIPDWLANSSAVSLPFDSLVGLKEEVLRRRD